MPDPDIGIIQIWQGSVINIPDGWVLCDGTNGTPDLRNDFIRGQGPGTPIGQTGGSSTHTHDFTTDGHTHGITTPAYINADAGHTRYLPSETDTGITDPPDQRPPYYSLCFIQYKGT